MPECGKSVIRRNMAVEDTKGTKTKLQGIKYNVYSTLTPLNCVLKMFGLYCVSRDGKKFKWPFWKVTFTTIVFLVTNISSIYLARKNSKRKKARFQDYFTLIYILGYVQYVVDLLFVYKYGRQRCLTYYNTFENIDRVIGMPYYNQIKRSVAKICIFFIIIGSIYFVIDYTAIVLLYGWFLSTVHSVDYIYTVIKILSALDGIAHFIQVKFRLKRIGDVLEGYYSSLEPLSGVTKDVVCKKNWTRTYIMSHPLELMNTIGYNSTKVIIRLSRCYLLLLEQCDYINGLFGFRILFGGLVYLMEMVMLTNLIIRLTMGTMIPFHNSSLFTILLSTAMKIVNYSAILLCGISCCEQTYKQSHRIIRCIDHLVTNKKLTSESYEALKELRDLVTSRPVMFSALNFYTLDHPTMLAMASAIVTYTIILLQNMQ